MSPDEDRGWPGDRVRVVGADEGRSVLEAVLDPDRLIETVAGELRRLHATPLDGCPVETSDELLLEEARLRVEHGAVDADRFDEPYQRHEVTRLLDVARRMRPAPPDPDPVLVHGEARLRSIRLLDDGALGWVDSPRFGAGDPYRDLACLSIDLAALVSPQSLGPFFDAYGIEHVDLVRLDFHVLLDQLLR